MRVAIALAGLTGIALADAMPPKLPKEIAELAKQLPASGKCTGKAFMPENVVLDMTGTIKTKTDYDGWWIHDTYESTMTSKTSGKVVFKYEAYTTYDQTAKKYRRVMIDNFGGYLTGASDGPKDGKLDFVLEGFGPLGQLQFRDHADFTTKDAVKMWGERSTDKGRTWLKDYESACKK